MPNPFHYGSAVRGADFTDRERELQALTGFMRNGINVILLSPRRYGKSSLALRAVEQLQKEKGRVARADLARCSASRKEFAEVLATAVFRDALGGVRGLTREFQRKLARVRASVRLEAGISPQGTANFSLSLAIPTGGLKSPRCSMFSVRAPAIARPPWRSTSSRRWSRLIRIFPAVEAGLERLMEHQGGTFAEILDRRPGIQQRILKALAQQVERQPFSAAFLRRADIGVAASVSKALKPLEDDELIELSPEGWRIFSPFFARWLGLSS